MHVHEKTCIAEITAWQIISKHIESGCSDFLYLENSNKFCIQCDNIQAIQWTCEAITASEYGAYITIKPVGSIQINKIDLCINKYIRLAIQF